MEWLRRHWTAKEGPSSVNRTTAFPRLPIRAGADRLVAQVGARVLGDLADRLGVVAGLSAALAPLTQAGRA
jgi:hypothetical protein